ncbi:hypothetical protein [Rhodomicrobium lacus]|uniref:hypothetical protein n=1 Tax=Rhodomicrobium lacus TaxID=2498452 RepID=UPI0013E0C68D|nr:hypothetical protein [Rhodomicrobium lacus]
MPQRVGDGEAPAFTGLDLCGAARLKLDTAGGPSIVLALAALFFVAAAPALALRGR